MLRVWAVQSETAPLQKIVKKLEAETLERKKEILILIIAITDSSLLREANTVQIRQILRPSTAVDMCTASDLYVRKCFLRLLRKKKVIADMF